MKRREVVIALLGTAATWPLEGLLRAALPYQLRPRDRSPASPHIRLDLCDPSRCVLRQARHPPGTADHPRRPLGTCRHWSDPRCPGGCRGSAIPWRMGGVGARYVSHRDRLATRTAEPHCDGIAAAPSSDNAAAAPPSSCYELAAFQLIEGYFIPCQPGLNYRIPNLQWSVRSEFTTCHPSAR